eukprot:c40686_g1_i1 orf=3-152(-)
MCAYTYITKNICPHLSKQHMNTHKQEMYSLTHTHMQDGMISCRLSLSLSH